MSDLFGGDLVWRQAGYEELLVLAALNRQLQEDEGSSVMSMPALTARLDRWLRAGYTAAVFEREGRAVAYVLYRDSDPDAEGEGAVYVRQFLVAREARRQGVGRHAFGLLESEILPAGQRIILEVLATNPVGQAFWESLGFARYSVKYKRDSVKYERAGPT